MGTNISITIDDANREFLERQSINRSAFVNRLIEQERERQFAASMEAGYKAQAEDLEIQSDDRDWEIAIGDGIED